MNNAEYNALEWFYRASTERMRRDLHRCAFGMHVGEMAEAGAVTYHCGDTEILNNIVSIN